MSVACKVSSVIPGTHMDMGSPLASHDETKLLTTDTALPFQTRIIPFASVFVPDLFFVDVS